MNIFSGLKSLFLAVIASYTFCIFCDGLDSLLDSTKTSTDKVFQRLMMNLLNFNW